MATNRKKTTAPPPKKEGGLKKIGALWLGSGKNGKFMSGRIEVSEVEEIRILVFKNNYKDEGERRPDYIIYEPETEAEKSGPATNEDIPF